jgi:hypothetical protein
MISLGFQNYLRLENKGKVIFMFDVILQNYVGQLHQCSVCYPAH